MATVSFTEANILLGTLALTQPRILAMCAMLPLFNKQVMPGLLRYGICAALGLVMVPALAPGYAQIELHAMEIILLLLKETFIGLVLGFLVAIPFWLFEAVGFLIDNQRGASLGAVINPATGNDTSDLGILFNQAFMVFFLVGGGFVIMLTMLYDSFLLWDIWSWWPVLDNSSIPLFLDQLSRLMRLMFLYAAPVVIAMFLSEFGLALIGRFVPQLQVFFLALPIKSALAMFVLVLYMYNLFTYADESVQSLIDILPFLDQQWGGL